MALYAMLLQWLDSQCSSVTSFSVFLSDFILSVPQWLQSQCSCLLLCLRQFWSKPSGNWWRDIVAVWRTLPLSWPPSSSLFHTIPPSVTGTGTQLTDIGSLSLAWELKLSSVGSMADSVLCMLNQYRHHWAPLMWLGNSAVSPSEGSLPTIWPLVQGCNAEWFLDVAGDRDNWANL